MLGLIEYRKYVLEIAENPMLKSIVFTCKDNQVYKRTPLSKSRNAKLKKKG